ELSGVFGGIHSMHRTISDRAFRWVGPGGVPIRAAHDRAAAAVYGGLGGATRGLGRAAAGTVARRPRWSGRVISQTPQGAALIAALDGLIGDTLERKQS